MDFNEIPKIDAHIHYNCRREALLREAESNNFRFVSINTTVPDFPDISEQESIILELQQSHPRNIFYVGTFPIVNWNSEEWVPQTIDYINKRMENGALGIKIWKNVGMSLRDTEGHLVMIDDPKLEPVFNYMEDNGITFLGHQGEPKNCWLPIDEMTVNQDIDYYSGHPEYHMYKHPEFPSYEDQINARDNVLKKHKKMRFVGAHLASLEWDTNEIARRLDEFPNMAVDMAERICHLEYQCLTDWEKVYDFFVTYQDRLIYGTDIIYDESYSDDEIRNVIKKRWLDDWEFFTTNKMMSVPRVNGLFKGLGLPEKIIHKIYYRNALKYFLKLPGSH